MFGRLFSMGGTLLLAGAMLVLTAEPARAQRHGGYRGGGGWSGGGGGYGGGGYFGGYRGGSYGYRPSYGSYYGSPFYGGYRGFGYGTYQPWGSTGYYSTHTYTMPYQEVTSGYPSGDIEEATPPMNAAHVTVRAPANATVWIGGWQTPNTGSVREFDSPPLTPGKQYSYEVKAQWEENGRTKTQTQEVDVSAGARARAVFPMSR